MQPQSAFLRHVLSVPDIRELVKHLRSMKMDVRPLYTLEGTTVDVSSDTYQNGMTRTAYEEAKAKGTLAPPTRTGGYIIFWGPENVLMETTERNTLKPGEVVYGLVDMWQDHSICAELWYTTHLNTPARAGRGGAPRARVHRGHLQGAEERAQLPVGGEGGHEASARRRRRFRPCLTELVRLAVRHAARAHAWPARRSHRGQRADPRSVDREAQGRECDVPAAAVQVRRHVAPS